MQLVDTGNVVDTQALGVPPGGQESLAQAYLQGVAQACADRIVVVVETAAMAERNVTLGSWHGWLLAVKMVQAA
jgi:hypothetical protein